VLEAREFPGGDDHRSGAGGRETAVGRLNRNFLTEFRRQGRGMRRLWPVHGSWGLSPWAAGERHNEAWAPCRRALRAYGRVGLRRVRGACGSGRHGDRRVRRRCARSG
jgi:hypothetical protein